MILDIAVNLSTEDTRDAIAVFLCRLRGVESTENEILIWLRRLVSEKCSANQVSKRNQRTPEASQTRVHGKRTPKVWLVPSGEDMMEHMMDLLEEFGTMPPLPTAMFPCDSTTTATAVSEMAWRLRRAADILDDEGQQNRTQLVDSILLCPHIIVVTHPDTLSPRHQEVLLEGIGELAFLNCRQM